MSKRQVMINILSKRTEYGNSLFEAESDEELMEDDGDEGTYSDEPIELLTEGRLLLGEHRVELVYEESELSGMEGSVTSIGFDIDSPMLVTMMRSGAVSTALVFEEGKRHICVYRTPFSDFEVCAVALKVENRLLDLGRLDLDYVVEIHGAQAERCKMCITVRELPELTES